MGAMFGILMAVVILALLLGSVGIILWLIIGDIME